MNTLPGSVASVDTGDNLSIVKISPAAQPGDRITAIVIDTPGSAAYLRQGCAVLVLFKETEVIIAKDFTGLISVQNKFRCTIKAVEKGKLLAKVILDYAGAEINSIITVNAVNTLALAAGDMVTALVKTNEISIAPHD